MRPDSDRDLGIELPVTTNCAAQRAVCTADGRKLSNQLQFTVSGPGQQRRRTWPDIYTEYEGERERGWTRTQGVLTGQPDYASGEFFAQPQTYRRVEEDRPPGITPRPGDGCLGDFTLPLEQSNPGRDETKRPRVKLNRDAVWEVLDRPGMSRNQLARQGGPSSGYFSHVPRPVAAGTDG